MTDVTVVWRRLDRPGHEWARLRRTADGWNLSGIVVMTYEAAPVRLEYTVTCKSSWETLAARVIGKVADRSIEIELIADGAGCWTLAGRDCPHVEGCLDVDLGFSPSTNLLPVRRLGLEIGARAPVSAAWLPFPSFELQRLNQSYTRTAERAYVYESGGGKFVAELDVNAAGLVTRYGRFWELEATSGEPD